MHTHLKKLEKETLIEHRSVEEGCERNKSIMDGNGESRENWGMKKEKGLIP